MTQVPTDCHAGERDGGKTVKETVKEKVKEILANLSFSNIVILVVAIVAGYIFTVILYSIGAVRFYKKKHQVAKNGVKKHVRDLEILERMYEREEA